MSNITYQLRVYASVFSSEPAEVRHIPEGVILGDWLADNVKGFNPESTDVSYSQALDLPVRCDIDCYIVPQGGVVKGITKIFKKAVSFVGALLGLKKPSMPKANQATQQSTELDMATAKNQTVKYGQPIREAFGRNKIVPDYLVPPRRYFLNKKEHWMDTLLCVGVGDHLIDDNEIFISNSPINKLGSGNGAQVFAPNEDVSVVDMADWWHTSSEVGPTSQGSSGLKLESASNDERLAESGNYLFSGKTITALDSQQWPSSWQVGDILDVGVRQQYEVKPNGESPEPVPALSSLVIGNFSGLDLSAEDTVSISGAYSRDSVGVFEFNPSVSSTDGTASTWVPAGEPSLDYDVNPAQFIVTCGSASAVILLNDDYASKSALVSDLNDKLNVTPVAGTCEFTSDLAITELPNYSARTITVQSVANASAVFGDLSQATFTRGQARVEDRQANATLFPVPVRGYLNLMIRKANTYHVITNISGSSINVDLVDGNNNLIPWSGWEDDVASNDPLISRSAKSIQTLWRGPFAATPSNELCTHIEYDVFFPQGLNRANDDGDPTPHACSSVFRYRERDTDNWIEEVRHYNERENDQLGFTHRITLPRPMRIAEAQLRRGEAESTSARVTEEMQWFGLRAKMVRQKARYPNLTTLAVRVNGSTVAAQSDSEINLVATRKLDGVPTRKVTDAVRYIARSADINEQSMANLDAALLPRDDHFDFQFNSFATVSAAAKKALSVGFAELTIKDGLLSAVRDAKRPPELLHAYNHTYSAQNTTADISISVEMPDPDEIDGYDVEYIDERTWRVETVRCQLPNSAGTRIAKITADGITNRNRAYRWGMRQLMTELLDNKTLSTKTELDALNSQFGDYVNFVQEVPGWSQSALVASYSGNTITSTEPLDWGAGQHVVALRRNDGSMSEVKAATKIDDYTLSVGEPFETEITPHETHLFFGTQERFANPAIVRQVTPRGDGATINAIAYNANKYQYDDAEAPQ